MLDVIKSSTDISLVFKNGKRWGNHSGKLIVLQHDQHGQSGRVAFVAGKKLGNAVWRNRAKRRLRAVCRELQGPWDNYDVVLMASRGTTEVPYEKLLRDYRTALERLGVSQKS